MPHGLFFPVNSVNQYLFEVTSIAIAVSKNLLSFLTSCLLQKHKWLGLYDSMISPNDNMSCEMRKTQHHGLVYMWCKLTDWSLCKWNIGLKWVHPYFKPLLQNNWRHCNILEWNKWNELINTDKNVLMIW